MEQRFVGIVDDDKIFRFTTTKYLEYVEHVSRTTAFKSVNAALEYISSHLDVPSEIPDILLLDVNMPVKDGWEFMEEFNKFKEKIPKPIYIYMVSSSIDERDSARARKNSGITDYIVKPLDEVTLINLVKRTFDQEPRNEED